MESEKDFMFLKEFVINFIQEKLPLKSKYEL